MFQIAGVQVVTPVAGALAAALSIIVYHIAQVIYLLFFHPLAKYPGPKIAAISDLWWVWELSSGRLPFTIADLHKKYGDVVRIRPNELSFATAEAFQDIHGHVSQGKPRFLKTEFYDNDDPTPRITGARDPEVHARQRKSLSHAFSAKSLREQEEIVQKYIDGFLRQLNKLGKNGEKALNMSETFNWLTFDVIGDLSFGEPFGGVEKGETHIWIKVILDSVLNAQTTFLRQKSSFYNIILPFLLPEGANKKLKIHRTFSREKSRKRIQLGDTGRADFFSHMLKRATMSEAEMMSQTASLIIAGSETTATSLSGTTFFLLKNPDCMAKLQSEVRGAFTSVEEITGDSTAGLPYLHGVVEESLRLFPPVPFSMPRYSPGGMVDGHYIPKGAVVSVSALNMPRDERYWHDGESFRPERWIGKGFNDHKKASQPFSAGARACLGINLAYLEMRIVLAKLVWLYDWELAVPRDEWVRDCKMRILWKKPDLWVKYQPRAGA
ncbi:cytochrome P450 monooxygenase-like protein [Xylaria bambusicola]|uniref:cytochrome P450 monooxygenase-like protein n=1 Tax=Xylaria bambusicola TaxID=326684 RepID=UPI0020077618|nr:cytochrome P450 monooxygenase-like protein [Xylaria bambusicola]KAI0515085.1 cytochrome P450 monooxygenase-like protein [Xylaria bambusicola]